MNRVVQALKYNHLSFRKIPSGRGSIFFCKKENQATFDIEMTDSGRIRVWSYFAEGVPGEYSGGRLEFRSEGEEDIIIGLETVEESVLSLFFEQNMPFFSDEEESSLQTARLASRLNMYLKLLTRLRENMKKEGLRLINAPLICENTKAAEKRESVGQKESCSFEHQYQNDTFTDLAEKLEQVVCRLRIGMGIHTAADEPSDGKRNEEMNRK